MTAPANDVDFAHTQRAENNRKRKAHRLALAAASMGLQYYELKVVGGTQAEADTRTRVRRAARIDRDPSVETWQLAIGMLMARAGTLPGALQCPRCDAYVLRVVTEAGSKILIDPFPHPSGSVFPHTNGQGLQVARVLAGHDPKPDEPLYRQHTASCPASPTALRARARRCLVCSRELDAVLAARDPSYTTHPTCEPGEEANDT